MKKVSYTFQVFHNLHNRFNLNCNGSVISIRCWKFVDQTLNAIFQSSKHFALSPSLSLFVFLRMEWHKIDCRQHQQPNMNTNDFYLIILTFKLSVSGTSNALIALYMILEKVKMITIDVVLNCAQKLPHIVVPYAIGQEVILHKIGWNWFLFLLIVRL